MVFIGYFHKISQLVLMIGNEKISATCLLLSQRGTPGLKGSKDLDCRRITKHPKFHSRPNTSNRFQKLLEKILFREHSFMGPWDGEFSKALQTGA